MKILHTADIHLGVKNGRLSSEKQAQMRSESILQVQDLFAVAKQNNFDVVLICGDLFHAQTVTNKLKLSFFEAVKDFGRPVIYINGNHDEFIMQNDSTPSNFVVLNKENFMYEVGDVVFWSNTNLENLQANFSAKKKNVLLLHGNIENATDNDYINVEKFKNFNFDYVALGHTHVYKVFEVAKTPYVYCGSLFSNGFDECGNKGYVEISLDKKLEYKFVPFAKRRYMICECDISDSKGYYSILNKIRQILLNSDVKNDDLVRIVLTGEYEEGLDKNIDVIAQSFNHLFYFEIVDKSRIKIDVEKLKNEVFSFKAEFINLVENSQMEEDEKNLICRLGLEALNGEDLSIW